MQVAEEVCPPCLRQVSILTRYCVWRISCAYGATNVLADAGISPDDAFIISAGAEPFALYFIRADSYLRGTVAIDREVAARLMVYSAIDMLAGNPYRNCSAIPPARLLPIRMSILQS